MLVWTNVGSISNNLTFYVSLNLAGDLQFAKLIGGYIFFLACLNFDIEKIIENWKWYVNRVICYYECHSKFFS